MTSSDTHSKSNRRSQLGCVLAIAAFLVVFVVLPVLSVMFFQPKAEEQVLIQSKLDIQALWRLGKFALASLAVVAAASALLFLFTRWRKIRVFITFHHSLEERIRIMRDQLHAQGLVCDFIPFDPQALHDNILSRVTNNI